MDVLTIDVGATQVKMLARGQKERREFEPGSQTDSEAEARQFRHSLIRR